MSKAAIARFAACLLAVCTISVYGGGAMSQNKLVVETREISDISIAFPVLDKSYSVDAPLVRYPHAISLAAVDSAPRGSVDLYSAIWDWDRSLFSDGPRTLVMNVSVNSYSGPLNLVCESDFGTFMRDYVSDSNEWQAGSDLRFRVNYRLERVFKLGNGGGLMARMVGQGGERSVAVFAPIDERHYVEFRFNFHTKSAPSEVSSLSQKDRRWLEAIQGEVDRMILGIRLSGTADCSSRP